MKIKTWETKEYLFQIENSINEMMEKGEIDKIISTNFWSVINTYNKLYHYGVLIYEESIKFKTIDEFK